MKDTRRDLPRALHSSMTIVLLLFVGANISYFVVLDPKIVASTNTVALDFGRVTLGKFGAVVFSCLVSISCFGALSASFYTSKLALIQMERVGTDRQLQSSSSLQRETDCYLTFLGDCIIVGKRQITPCSYRRL
jgi:amino acid transporter